MSTPNSSSASTSPNPSPKLDLTETEVTKAYDSQMTVTPLSAPYRLRGKVVHGFKRGSKLLGCPTANLDPASFRDILHDVPRGVYAGFAMIHPHGTTAHDSSSDYNHVFKTVLSLGYNPTFDTKEETVEAYILHDFSSDFYGHDMSLMIVAYMRPSQNFTSLDALIAAICSDVRVGSRALGEPPLAQYHHDDFFKNTTNTTTTPTSTSTSTSTSSTTTSPCSSTSAVHIYPSPFANTPSPPYVAVIFSSQRTSEYTQEYNDMSILMDELVTKQVGYLGYESSRDTSGFGHTISYWRTMDDARIWKMNVEHQGAQKLGKQQFYSAYHIRIAEVQRDYGWVRDDETTTTTATSGSKL